MRLVVEDLGWTVNTRRILDGVSFAVEAGEFVGLLGPNGCGKTTALRCIYRALRPKTGRVLLDGHDLWRMSRQAVARRVAVLAQDTGGEWEYTVEETVAMGRTPHKRLLEPTTLLDAEIVARALADVTASHLAGRDIVTLSGGERQRVLLARALVQQPELLVLDEPTSHLDLGFQLDLLSLVRERGTTTLAVLHDVNLAAAFCDRIALLRDGRVLAFGSPKDVLTPALLAYAYGINATVTEDTDGSVFVRYWPARTSANAERMVAAG